MRTTTTTPVVTQPLRDVVKRGGRPARPFTCDICKLVIPPATPVLYANQDGGTGPLLGQVGWYVAIGHAEPCGAAFLRSVGDGYRQRPCRGCGRVMWLSRSSRRAHCNNQCRQADYRNRRAVVAEALTRGQVIYRCTRSPVRDARTDNHHRTPQPPRP